MTDNHPTRRDLLLAVAARPLIHGTLEAEAAESSLCFMSAVEMARLIRAKKLSAREALAAHLKQIERAGSLSVASSPPRRSLATTARMR